MITLFAVATPICADYAIFSRQRHVLRLLRYVDYFRLSALRCHYLRLLLLPMIPLDMFRHAVIDCRLR